MSEENHRPSVSIVMPVYNGEKYLREAVDSVLGQTLEDWELILVNDCSTDSTLAIMEAYRAEDARIRVISNETNRKLPLSLNIGFGHARGKYFTWTSDDNRYLPEALEEMMGYLEKSQETGMVYGDMDYIDEEGEKTGSVSREPEELYGSNCVGACFLYRREAAEAVGGYDPDLFLVEDYDYWIRIARRYPVAHLPHCLYEYRNHGRSLTQTKAEKIERQLYRLRIRELDFLLSRAQGRQKEVLFIEMWRQDPGKRADLQGKFFGGKELPGTLKWIEGERGMDESRKIILFGAGAFGKKALDYFGSDRVAYYVDNNAALAGSRVNGIEVISFEALKKMHEDYRVVISVDARKIPVLAEQLEENHITGYEVYLEMVRHMKRPSGETAVSWLEICGKARGWIQEYTEAGKGIAHSSMLRTSYPEVTGYYIPTLMRWGFTDQAESYAKWLISIQHSDGAWYDTEGRDPYVFDSAQILKGLLAVRDRVDGADEAIRRGCDWLLENMEESGRLTTPSREAWGEEGICSELIHLYCLSPLHEAAEVFGEERYRSAAEKTAGYYIRNYKDKICDFSFLSHFYAYVMEGLLDIGQEGLVREAMGHMERILDEKGYVPAYRDVNWVCSTGLFQLAVVWFKLGDLGHGSRALTYAAGLQNESGGWYGSYPTSDAPRAADRKEYPDYFADREISWAVKYFLDAVYFKNKLEFEGQAAVFSDTIAEEDGRYQVIFRKVQEMKAESVCDVGCGKGRYLKNLHRALPGVKCCGVDLSDQVMREIDPAIETRSGILTQIPYPDNTFDMVYAVESLEHSIFPDNAVREMLRVVKPGGKAVIIDKNKAALGLLEIDEWEQWFEDSLFGWIAEETGCTLEVIQNVPYEDGIADGLFNAWVLGKESKK